MTSLLETIPLGATRIASVILMVLALAACLPDSYFVLSLSITQKTVFTPTLHSWHLKPCFSPLDNKNDLNSTLRPGHPWYKWHVISQHSCLCLILYLKKWQQEEKDISHLLFSQKMPWKGIKIAILHLHLDDRAITGEEGMEEIVKWDLLWGPENMGMRDAFLVATYRRGEELHLVISGPWKKKDLSSFFGRFLNCDIWELIVTIWQVETNTTWFVDEPRSSSQSIRYFPD